MSHREGRVFAGIQYSSEVQEGIAQGRVNVYAGCVKQRVRVDVNIECSMRKTVT